MRGIVVTIIGLMVMLLVGIIVVQSLVTSQDSGNQRKTWSDEANDTWDSLIGNIWVAFTLIVICPIIIGAVAILAYLSFGRGGGL